MRVHLQTKLEFMVEPGQVESVIKKMRLQRIKSFDPRVECFYEPESRLVWTFNHDEMHPANEEIEQILSQPSFLRDIEIRNINALPYRYSEWVM